MCHYGLFHIEQLCRILLIFYGCIIRRLTYRELGAIFFLRDRADRRLVVRDFLLKSLSERLFDGKTNLMLGFRDFFMIKIYVGLLFI